MLVDVAADGELAEGVPHIVAVGPREIALVRWKGQVYAVRNLCPHQSESFAGGRVVEQVTGAERIGQLGVGEEPLLICPWHNWQYKLSSGECAVDPRLRVKAYRVVARGGRVLVDVPSAAGS
jgi:nitrite reductase/ring-hydroxylating ferredoxin subunit